MHLFLFDDPVHQNTQWILSAVDAGLLSCCLSVEQAVFEQATDYEETGVAEYSGGSPFFPVYSSAGRAEGDAAAGICRGILSLDNHEGGIPKSPRTYTPRNDTESGYKRRNAGPPDGLHLDHGERYPMGTAWSGRALPPPAWA